MNHLALIFYLFFLSLNTSNDEKEIIIKQTFLPSGNIYLYNLKSSSRSLSIITSKNEYCFNYSVNFDDGFNKSFQNIIDLKDSAYYDSGTIDGFDTKVLVFLNGKLIRSIEFENIENADVRNLISASEFTRFIKEFRMKNSIK